MTTKSTWAKPGSRHGGCQTARMKRDECRREKQAHATDNRNGPGEYDRHTHPAAQLISKPMRGLHAIYETPRTTSRVME